MRSVLPGRAFWAGQFAHQAPMLGAMVLMLTVLRSVVGVLAIVAALWVVALIVARPARRSVRARELLLDVLAMALVLVVPVLAPVLAGVPDGMPGMPGMPGMARMSAAQSGDPILTTLVIVSLWATGRLLLARTPSARAHRLGSAVSGCCCAAGLLAMLVL